MTEAFFDKSTGGVQCVFTDEKAVAVIPLTLTWSLYNENGAVINSRTDVSVSSLKSTQTIVLSGDDLKYSDGVYRILVLKATFTSDLGVGLPLNKSFKFPIKDLLGI